MALIIWNGAAGDQLFSTPGNWAGGVVPGPADDAVIMSAVTVQAAGGSVNTLSLGAQTVVVVENGSGFTIAGAVTAADPTGTSSLSGVIEVNDNSSLSLDGVVAGTGTIALASGGGDTTNLVVGATGATLTGGGTILLGDVSGNNRIYGASGSDVLVNAGDTIEGSGQIGVGQLTFTNQALVDATGLNNGLFLNAATVNTGTLEATGPAGLFIQSTVTNTGGLIEAVGPATVMLDNADDIVGGTLATTGPGLVQLSSSQAGTLDGASSGALTNAGSFQIDDNATLDVYGTIHNTGTIALASGGGDTANLVAAGSVVTLNGGGTIFLGDVSGNNRIYGATGGDTLVNVDNTIEGSGQIGVGQLTFTNQALVDATGLNNGLFLDAATTNTGILEATGPAGLFIQSTVTNIGGLIEAAGTASVILENADDIIGGTLATTGQGLVQLFSSQNGTLDGITGGALTNAGSFQIDDDATLSVYGTIHNTGTIALASGGGDISNLVAAGSVVTLNGGGTLFLGDVSGNNRIYGATGGDTLVNVDNTIEGSGQIGVGQLTFTNKALVDATGLNNGLFLNAVTTNTGILEATGPAGLFVQSTVTNTGGLIEAVGPASVMLENADDIIGGTLATTGSGLVQLSSSQAGTLDGATGGALTNAGSFQVDDNATLDVYGTIHNTGTIALASGGGDTANLVAAGSVVTLNGGGTIFLGDVSGNNRILSATGAETLLNVDNTIEGSGQIGAGQLTFSNEALVDATGLNNGLFLNTATTNTGTLEATGPAGLFIQSTVTNTGGLIEAVGPASVMLANADDIVGGTVATTSAGLVQLLTGQAGTLDGITSGALTNAGSFQIDDNATLDVYGTIHNTGTIALASGGGDTANLVAAGSVVTLNGGGTIFLGDVSGNNRIYGATGADTLVNSDNTIEGSGQIGAGQLTFTNEALVEATGTDSALVLNATTTNTGTFEATGPAGLVIQSTVFNNGGTIEAVGDSSVVLANADDIVGGTVTTAGNGLVQLLTGQAGTLDGSSGALTNAGSFQIDDNATLDVYGTINNTGTIALASGGGDTSNLVAAGSVVTLTGGGTVVLGNISDNNRIYGTALDNADNTIEGVGQIGVGQLTLANTGTVEALAGYLDLNATLTQAGSLVVKNGGELEINQADPNGSVTFAGTANTLLLDTPNSFGATLNGFVAGDTLALAGDTVTAAMLEGTTLALTLDTGITLDYALTAPNPAAQVLIVPYGGGTDIELAGGNAPCYAAGTRILTIRGEVAVEALVVGDEIVTPLNRPSRPVVWLGRRRVHCDRHPNRALADPVRVRAGAFGRTPHRDLVLSPDHAVWFEGALIPINLLIDGETILQERRATVTYHHVELDRHDVILAEGLPAESYLDTGNRSRFANASLVTLHPHYVPGFGGQPCAPMVLDGPRLDRIRSARAAASSIALRLAAGAAARG